MAGVKQHSLLLESAWVCILKGVRPTVSVWNTGYWSFMPRRSDSSCARGSITATPIPETDAGAYARDAGTDHSHLYSVKWHSRLGPIFRDYDMRTIFVSSAGMVAAVLNNGDKYPQLFIPPAWRLHEQLYAQRRGLMFLQGACWWQARRKLNPLLLKSCNLKQMNDSLETGVDRLLATWKPGVINSLDKDMYSWIGESLLEVLLGHRWQLSSEPLLVHVKGLFQCTARLMLVDVDEAAQSESSDWMEFCMHLENVMAFFKKLISQHCGNLQGVAGKLHREGMSFEDIEQFVADLLLGGTDTTSITSSWLLFCLADNPKVQDRLREEIVSVCGERKVSTSDLANLQLCRGLLKEAMRVYPVAPFLARIISRPVSVDGYSISANSFIAISSYVMGRNADLFPNPEEIIPERWTRQSSSTQSVKQAMALSCLPFGHGARMCLGRRIAEQQMLLLLARCVQRWNLTTTSRPTYITRMVGVPSEQLAIQLQPLHHH